MAWPHACVASLIPIFAVLPMVKTLFFPFAGPLKDVLALAGICAGAAIVIKNVSSGRRQRSDFWVVTLIGFLIALYVVNLGGGLERDIAWLHGVRLFTEPLILLLVGLTLGDPRRTLAWSQASLIATATGVALYGIAQQILGVDRLLGLGYAWDVHLRLINEHLRSFGTLDEPFAYAALLLFGLAAVVFGVHRGPLVWLAGLVILAGLAPSYVRSALVSLVALVGLWLVRKGRHVTAGFMLVIVVVGAMLLISSEQATEKRTVQSGPAVFYTANGRTEAWRVMFNDPWELPLGKGVGEVGTAKQRATFTLTRSAEEARQAETFEVDSGYFATIADVGLVGLTALLLLIARLGVVLYNGAKRGLSAGWFGLALLLTLVFDAITRESFTAFPTAFLGLLLVGISLGAILADEREGPPKAAAAPR
jgi:uncharacterized membrane protein YhaH (DUF805 family)